MLSSRKLSVLTPSRRASSGRRHVAPTGATRSPRSGSGGVRVGRRDDRSTGSGGNVLVHAPNDTRLLLAADGADVGVADGADESGIPGGGCVHDVVVVDTVALRECVSAAGRMHGGGTGSRPPPRWSPGTRSGPGRVSSRREHSSCPNVGVVEAGNERAGVAEDLSQRDGPSRRGCRPWPARSGCARRC